jgi:hypothetical protein
MTTTAPRSRGRLGRLLRSRWTLITVVGLTIVGLAGSAVAVIQKFDPFRNGEVAAEYLPSAFAASVTVVANPLVTRTGTVSLELVADVPAGDGLARVELWDGDRLYYAVTPDAGLGTGGSAPTGGTAIPSSFTVDYVPLTAGTHVLSTRTITTSGAIALSAPLTLPVLDHAVDLDPLVAGTDGSGRLLAAVSTSPGETVASVAARLGVAATDLWAEGGIDLNDPAYSGSLPVGSRLRALAPTVDAAHAMSDFGVLDVSKWLTPLSGEVDGCTVTIAANDDRRYQLYSSTAVHPGFVRVGDVAPGAPFVSDTTTVGVVVYQALPVGTDAGNIGDGERIPTAPVKVVVPDSCLSNGWSGTARVANGALITDVAVTRGYAYLSVDGAAWRRFPEDPNLYLPDPQLNDVRIAVPFTGYDQIDVEVWSNDGGTAALVAEGQYCHATALGVEGSGGSCTPPESAVTAVVEAPDIQLSVTVASDDETPQLNALADDPAAPIESNPYVQQTVHVDGPDQELTFRAWTDGGGATTMVFQYSYFPIGPDTLATAPPGAFKVVPKQTVFDLAASGPGETTTVRPWEWRNLQVEPGEDIVFGGEGTSLALDDEIALALANQNLATGNNLVDTFYVRAVGVLDQPTGPDIVVGASPTIRVDMRDDAAYPQIVDPVVVFRNGTDFDSTQGYQGICFEPTLFPEDATGQVAIDQGKANWAAGRVAPGFFAAYNFETQQSESAVWEQNDDFAVVASVIVPDAVYCVRPDLEDAQRERERKAGECALTCVITAGLVGLAVGYLTGGIGGALVAGAIVTALALAGGVGLDILQSFTGFYKTISDAYNAAYQTVLQIAALANPACIAIKAVGEAAESHSETAESACEAVTKAVVSVVITTVTGLPPQLPTSQALAGIAGGEMKALIVFAMDTVLAEIGLSCQNLTLEGEEYAELAEYAGSELGGTAETIFNEATVEGGVSGCAAVAGLAVEAVRQQIASIQQSQQMQQFGYSFPPGMVVAPVGDELPTVSITGAAGPGVLPGAHCPATINTTLTGNTFSGTLQAQTLKPITVDLIAAGDGGVATTWAGALPVAVDVTGYVYDPRGLVQDPVLVFASVPADPTAPFLDVLITAPCLPESVTFTVQNRSDVYVPDPRPVLWYG